jgi:peptidoglycan/xylan/chitin deacetylase (PgdA/CDA1 family)
MPVVARVWLVAAIGLVLLLGACGGAHHAERAHARPRRTARQAGHLAPHAQVPILMYHVIDTAPASTALARLWVPRGEFAAEVDDLAARGYHGVTLQQVWDAWGHGGRLPSKPIVFSFDDGYSSQETNAMPVLRAHRWPGVLNLEVATLHTTMRPSQVRALIRAGWEVDSHTMTHPDLRTVRGARLAYEVAGARRWIRRTFGVPANFFCYPAGDYDAHVIAAVKGAGYLAATTVKEGVAGPADPPYELPRIRVDAGEGRAGVERSLAQAERG